MSGMLAIPEIAKQYANKQPLLVDSLTEDAPVLKRFKWEQSTHGLWHLAEEVTEINGAGFVQLDAPLPDMSVETALKKVDLSIMGGKLFVGEDKATQYGGKDKYLADKLPKLYADSGMNAEKSILYNKIRASAITYGCAINAGGAGYSVLCVRMKAGENGGLYDPKMFKQGTLLETVPLYGGNLYTNEKGVVGWGWRSKSYFGWQVMVKDANAAVVNIDSSHPLTEAMFDNLLEKAKFDKSGDVIVIAHSNLRPTFNSFKRSKIQITSAEKKLDVQLDDINGVPIVYTRNMLAGSESAVTGIA